MACFVFLLCMENIPRSLFLYNMENSTGIVPVVPGTTYQIARTEYDGIFPALLRFFVPGVNSDLKTNICVRVRTYMRV